MNINIKEELENTLEFRQAKAIEYPDDTRNQNAVEIITSLLSQDLSKEAQAKIDEAWNNVDGIMASESQSAMLKGIGFDSAETSLDEFVTELASEIMNNAN